MKKLLFLFALLLTSVGAWAQTSQKYYKPGPRTLTLEAGKEYFISVATYYGGACTNLLYNNNGTLAKSNLLPNVITFESSYIFTVEEVGDEYLAYIKNSSGKYIQADNLASTETKTGVYVIPYFTGKAVCCGDDVDACDANGNRIAYNDITVETPIVTVQKNADYTKADNRNGWRYISGLSAGVDWCTAFAFYEAEEVESPMELTTDTSSPILYTIKNVRGGGYVAYDGAAHQMRMSPLVENASFLFYFTQGTTQGTYKIHNYVTEKKCNNFNSWTDDGIDWYIKPSGCATHVGLAIANQEELTDENTTNEAWNDESNAHKAVAMYGGNDAASVWDIAKFEGEIPTIQLSTEGNIKLNYIRSIRQDSYVNFDGHNSTFKEGALGLNSYWYFIQDEEEQENAPDGYIACRIFNAAHRTAVENFTSGYMEDASYAAKIFYIGLHEASNKNGEGYGYIIRLKSDANNGWHDYGGTYIGSYGLNDRGSHWRIYPADKTPDNLKSDAATLRTNSLNTIAGYEFADYFCYSDDAISTAKNAITAFDVNAHISSAVTALKEIPNLMAELENSETSTDSPADGDRIILKNRQYATNLSINGSNNLNGTSSGDFELVWTLETTGVEGEYYLYNEQFGLYAGPLAARDNASTSCKQNKEEAGKYRIERIGTTTYASLCDAELHKTEASKCYLHHSNWPNKEIVRWNNAEGTHASHWLVSELTSEENEIWLAPYDASLETELKNSYDGVGTGVGQYVIVDNTDLQAKQSEVETLLNSANRTKKQLTTAKEELAALWKSGTLVLPEAGKYYIIKSANPSFWNIQGNEMAMYSANADSALAWKAVNYEDKSFYWKITPNNQGKYILQNTNDNKYVPALASDKYTMTDDETKANAFSLTWLGPKQFNIAGNGTMHMAGHNSGKGTGDCICSWGGGLNSSSAWTIVEVEEPDLAIAKYPLQIRVDELNSYIEHSGFPGYYVSEEADKLQEPVSVAENVLNGGSTTPTDYEDALSTLNNSEAVKGLSTIVLPKDGKFYRIQNTNSTGYLSSGTGTGITQFVAGIAEDESSIFYYNNGKLMSYETGYYLGVGGNNSGFIHYTETVGDAVGTSITFHASPLVGKLLIEFKNETRSFYSNAAGNSNAAGADQTGEFYRFIIEPVADLPLTIHTSGKSTYSAPVDLTIPDGVTVYYAKRNDGETIRMAPLSDVIPANTGVVVEGAGTVTFPITTGAEALKNENLLKSVVAAEAVTAESGKSVFILATPTGKETGYYPLSTTNNIIGGHKSYLEIPTPANPAARLSIVWDDAETGIFETEGGEQNAEIYDLTGRRLDKPAKGVNVIGGKLVIK